MKRSITIAAILAATVLPIPAPAVEAHHQGTATSPSGGGQLADGEVRRVDKEAGKITLRHGPIPSLDMPAMSMVFQVKNPALLDQVKPGDKIKFNAEKAGSQYVVTHIEQAK